MRFQLLFESQQSHAPENRVKYKDKVFWRFYDFMIFGSLHTWTNFTPFVKRLNNEREKMVKNITPICLPKYKEVL